MKFNRIRFVARRHLVRYDDAQTHTYCGLPIKLGTKHPYLLKSPANKPDIEIQCDVCNAKHEAEVEEYAAECVWEGVSA